MSRFKKFSRKIIILLFLFSIMLIIAVCSAVGIFFYNKQMKEYNEYAYTYAKMAAEYIDGNRIYDYYEKCEKDDYYAHVQNWMNISQKNSDILYYSVFVPLEDGFVYIWDADNNEGACELGQYEEYFKAEGNGISGKEVAVGVMNGTHKEKIIFEHDDKYGYIALAFYPIKNSAGENVAIVEVDLSAHEIEENLWKFMAIVAASIVVTVLLMTGILFARLKKTLLIPLDKLTQASHDMVHNLENESAVHIDIRTGDELQLLAETFNNMFVEVREYIKKLSEVTAEKERIGAELSVATAIQTSMLPCIFPAFPDKPEVDIYALTKPAKEVGGDFYDFFMLDDTHIAIVIADVSGKGVPAALFMVIGKTLIKDHTKPERDLGDIFTEVNNILCESNSEGMFITAFEGVLDLVTGELRYVNAGHEIPFIYRKNKEYKASKLPAGLMLAGMEDMEYTSGSIMLEAGDRIFQYTDGVVEAYNPNDEFYGMKRLEKTLNIHKDKAPTELLQVLKEDVESFIGDAEQFDDITMICLEYKGIKSGKEQQI